jgi:hypothetical protein
VNKNLPALRPLCRALAGWWTAQGVLLLLGAAGVTALALALGDAVFDFPDDVRAAGRWLPPAAAAGAVLFTVWRIRSVNEHKLATLFERSNPSLGTRLTNAVQLGAAPGATPVEAYLRGEAVELGRQAAARLRAWPVARGAVLRAAACLLGAGAALLLFVTLGSDVLSAVWPRFADPRGDHPPFSRLRIEVQPQGAEVLYGGQIEIRAVTRGRPADKLWLVSQAGTNLNRAMMFLAPDRSFFLNLASLRDPVDYFITDGAARSHRFRISLRYSPQITGLELNAVFPEYTGLAPAPVASDGKDATLPMGTRVNVRALSNRPLQDGRLVLTPIMGGVPLEIVLKPGGASNSPAHAVTGSLLLTQAVAYAVSVRDVGGLVCTEPRKGRLNARPDAKPRLFVLEPGRDAVATPDFVVPVRVQAEDDYGVTRVFWLRGHNRSVERPFAMKLRPRGSPRLVEAEGEFALGQLGVQPGDVIEYYFEAADNDPLGPNMALSRVYRLEIISAQQLQEILRQQAAQQALFDMYLKLDAWQRRMAEQSRQLAAKAGNASPEAQMARRQDAAQLLKDLQEYNRQRDALLAMPELFDVESAFRETLRSQQQELRDAEAKLGKALGSGSGMPDEELLKDLAQALTRMAEQEQRDVAGPAEQIAAVANLLAQADVFTQMAQEQEAIARQLQRFASRSGALSRLEEMEVRELAERQRQLQQDLQRWTELLPRLVAALPEGEAYENLRNQVNNFLTDVKNADIPADLGNAVHSLEEPDPTTGYVLARQAAEKMDALIAKCSSPKMQQSASQCLKFQPSVSQSMGNTLQQILQAMGVGSGGDGRNGYSMSHRQVGIYGSAGYRPGGQQGGLGNGPGLTASDPRQEQIHGISDDPTLPKVEEKGPMRLNPDAPFPLRYRDVVGEYFRVISEAEKEK